MSTQFPLLANVPALPYEAPRSRAPKEAHGEECPVCGAKTVEYAHKMNANLARVLYKLYQFGKPARLRDLDLTVPEANNLQKLQYWGLIQHVGTRAQKTTYWQITQTGFMFLANRLAVQKTVWTYRAKVRRFEGDEVTVKQLVADYDWAIDYAVEAKAV